MKISRSGFTIVELLVVITVIGILATITVVSYNGVHARTRDDRRRTDVANIIKAMELYYSDNNSYPTPLTNTGSAINNGWYSSGDTSWSKLSTLMLGSQAIDVVPVDPINTPSGVPSAGGLVYAIYVNYNGGYCGATAGQMYMLVYKLEASTQVQKTDGTCSTNPLPSSYYSGLSYYQVVK
ncbi:MAG TPA: type II secretion system protein [Candidatus Saccharimonadales bacterium]|nr:type II secretion system protein [Candidatus Saccharimonadales bacterium]